MAVTTGEVIGLIKAFGGGSGGGGGGGSAVTVLNCTVDSNSVLTVPMKAGELATAMEQGVIMLKYRFLYNDGDNDHTVDVSDILYGASCEDETSYSFATYTSTALYADTSNDYPTATIQG